MKFNYVEFEYIFKVFPKQQNNKEIKNIKIEKKKKKR